jgi:hypothetical protein
MRALAFAFALLVTGCVSGPPPPPRAGRPTVRAPSAAPIPSPSSRPRGEVDVVVDDAPLPEVLDLIGRQAGWNLVCDRTAADARVTITLYDIGWRDALELILERTGCEARQRGENVLYVTLEPRITIQ